MCAVPLLLQREPEDGTSTFQQRVFICDEFWQPDPEGVLGPIFFYLGNEADVTL
jgi:lysosomal Pro-X carboxypeptidase